MRALLFDVFGTCVDWRTSIMREADRFGLPPTLAQAWRDEYQPQLETVRSGKRPWVNLDVLHRIGLNRVLKNLQLTLSDDDRAELVRGWHRLDPWPDVVGGLTRLKETSVIAPCSNGHIALSVNLAKFAKLPYGTLILTFSIVAIEVMLISTVMLGGGAPTVGRDTMFAVTMIVLNGVIGLSLVVGGLKHHMQEYSLPGASAYLSVIIPLVTIALILPSVTHSTDEATLSTVQAVLFAGATIVLYVIFILIQTGRHRDLFVHGAAEDHDLPPATSREIGKWVLLLVAGALPIVLLSKNLDKVVDTGIDALGAPVALSGVLIAMIVFTPEGISALKAAYNNQLQRTVNLCLGACLSTLGLTLPAVLTIGLITGENVILGLDPTGMVLIILTLLLSIVTFSGPKTTVLEGAVHLLVFFVYIVLVFSP